MNAPTRHSFLAVVSTVVATHPDAPAWLVILAVVVTVCNLGVVAGVSRVDGRGGGGRASV